MDLTLRNKHLLTAATFSACESPGFVKIEIEKSLAPDTFELASIVLGPIDINQLIAWLSIHVEGGDHG